MPSPGDRGSPSGLALNPGFLMASGAGTKFASWSAADGEPDLSRITEENLMNSGQRLVIIGRGGVGGPAAILSKKLMPEVDVTIVGEEDRFIVR